MAKNESGFDVRNLQFSWKPSLDVDVSGPTPPSAVTSCKFYTKKEVEENEKKIPKKNKVKKQNKMFLSIFLQ